jgi:acetyl-CoA acetyltransferase
MLSGPIPAAQRALKQSGLSINDIDLYEVNEAFASVPAAWVKELKVLSSSFCSSCHIYISILTNDW